jgi:hypothetical protein
MDGTTRAKRGGIALSGQPPVVIIGAGIGGLTLDLLLRQRVIVGAAGREPARNVRPPA